MPWDLMASAAMAVMLVVLGTVPLRFGRPIGQHASIARVRLLRDQHPA